MESFVEDYEMDDIFFETDVQQRSAVSNAKVMLPIDSPLQADMKEASTLERPKKKKCWPLWV